MVVAPMRAAGETLDINALLSEHVAATEQLRDDHALRVQADIATAMRVGCGWHRPRSTSAGTCSSHRFAHCVATFGGRVARSGG
eukprot:295729-Chlamydomonas_euryale.AAC.1